MQLDDVTVRDVLACHGAPTTLSLVDVPHGLVAVTGPNGSGKSTLFTAAIGSVYRLLPDRDHELVDYALSREAFLESHFRVDGQGVYRARVNLDNVSRASDAILELVAPDGARRILNDGKVTTFDAEVAKVFPSLPLLLASAFAAQNHRGSFAQLDRKGRKDLFADLLGLAHYETLAATCRQAVALVLEANHRLAGRVDALARDLGPERFAALEAEADRLQGERNAVELRRGALTEEIRQTEEALAGVQAQAARHAETQRTVDRLTVELQASERAIDHLQAEQIQTGADLRGVLHTADVEARATLDRLQADQIAAEDRYWRALQRIDGQYEAARQDKDARIVNNRNLLADADAIRAAAKVRDDQVAELTGLLGHLEAQLGAVRATEDDLVARQATLQVALAKARADVTRRTALEADLALATKVPFGDRCLDAGCGFVARAQAARTELPGLVDAPARLADLEAQERTLRAAHVAAQGARATVERHVQDRRARLAAVPPVDQRLASLDIAEARIAELETAKAALDAPAQAERDALEVDHAATLARLDAGRRDAHDRRAAAGAEATRRHDARLADLADALANALASRNALTERHVAETSVLQETAGAADEAATKGTTLKALQTTWTTSEAALARLTAEVAALERTRTDLQRKRDERDRLEARLTTITGEQADWDLLAKAFGRDGLPVLEIDAAGPRITQLCNDLLAACFGTRFTVELVTEIVKAGGKGTKETFELRVYDADAAGAARNLTDLSGGEQIIIDEALKAALSLSVNEQLGTPIRTCWRDETTGPLDEENTPRYVAMLRRMHELGGFAHTLFVTHNAAAARLSDTQIDIEDGRIARVVRDPVAA